MPAGNKGNRCTPPFFQEFYEKIISSKTIYNPFFIYRN